eukprot:7724296-Alexandrium_andersonii.AAC.1
MHIVSGPPGDVSVSAPTPALWRVGGQSPSPRSDRTVVRVERGLPGAASGSGGAEQPWPYPAPGAPSGAQVGKSTLKRIAELMNPKSERARRAAMERAGGDADGEPEGLD